MKPINELANKYGISELHIWSLIQQGKINRKIMYSRVWVDDEELRLYLKEHPREWDEYQKIK